MPISDFPEAYEVVRTVDVWSESSRRYRIEVVHDLKGIHPQGVYGTRLYVQREFRLPGVSAPAQEPTRERFWVLHHDQPGRWRASPEDALNDILTVLRDVIRNDDQREGVEEEEGEEGDGAAS